MSKRGKISPTGKGKVTGRGSYRSNSSQNISDEIIINTSDRSYEEEQQIHRNNSSFLEDSSSDSDTNSIQAESEIQDRNRFNNSYANEFLLSQSQKRKIHAIKHSTPLNRDTSNIKKSNYLDGNYLDGNTRKPSNSNICSPIKLVMYVLSSVLAIGLILCGSVNDTQITNQSVSILREKFQTQPEYTFDSIEAVLNNVLSLDPTHPAVFLILYVNDTSAVNEFIDSVAKYASEKLGKTGKYIDVNNYEFHSTKALLDYGYLIDKFKPQLEKTQVMVVKNLQDIPAQVAQVFHTFCDEFTPLVDRAVYLFTLKVNSLNGKSYYLASKALRENWKELKSDLLEPLITRISSTVLKFEEIDTIPL